MVNYREGFQCQLGWQWNLGALENYLVKHNEPLLYEVQFSPKMLMTVTQFQDLIKEIHKCHLINHSAYIKHSLKHWLHICETLALTNILTMFQESLYKIMAQRL